VRGVYDIQTSLTNMDVEIHIVKPGGFFGHHSFLTKESVASRRAEIEAAKAGKKKGTNKMKAKVGGGLGKMFGGGGKSSLGGGGLSMLSSLGASVTELQTLEKEKKENLTLPRSATVVARTHCQLLALSLDNFWTMMTYGDTIDQLMEHMRHFKTQIEIIRGFDAHKDKRKIWDNAATAVHNCGHSLGGMMKFEEAVPRPMKITVAGEAFRNKGVIMGGHFDVPAAIMRKRRHKSKLNARLRKAAKLGSFMSKVCFFYVFF
jgi:CRP-like cAMP-binding protein